MYCSGELGGETRGERLAVHRIASGPLGERLLFALGLRAVGSGGQRFGEGFDDGLASRLVLRVAENRLENVGRGGRGQLVFLDERLNLGVDQSVMWGEYFFCEALDKLLGAAATG